ncbi:MAG: prepilin-type N-terminal cleavage/methylation domain-containing protein [Pseudomonadales bacterium]
MRRFTSQRREQAGFTLIEIMIVIVIMGTIASVSLPMLYERSRHAILDVEIGNTLGIHDAVKVYRGSNPSWPDEANGCVGAINVLTSALPNAYLTQPATLNMYNSAYTTSCTPLQFSITQTIDPTDAGLFANRMLMTRVLNAAIGSVITTIGLPGTQATMRSKLSRVDTGDPTDRTMEADLLMGGQEITGVDDISFTPTGAETARISTSIRDLELAPAGDVTIVSSNLTISSGSITMSSSNPALNPSTINVTAGDLLFNIANDIDVNGGTTLAIDEIMLRNRSGTVPLSEMISNYVQKGVYLVNHNDFITKPICPSGTPKAIITPGYMHGGCTNAAFGCIAGAYSATWRAVDIDATRWQTELRTYAEINVDADQQGLAHVYCQYN